MLAFPVEPVCELAPLPQSLRGTRPAISLAMRTARESVEILTPGEKVPGTLIRPITPGRAAAALLLHGLSSTKERMAESIGSALADRGIASLAIDLPLHGGREGELSDLSPMRPFAIVAKWKLAVTDATAALDYLAT